MTRSFYCRQVSCWLPTCELPKLYWLLSSILQTATDKFSIPDHVSSLHSFSPTTPMHHAPWSLSASYAIASSARVWTKDHVIYHYCACAEIARGQSHHSHLVHVRISCSVFDGGFGAKHVNSSYSLGSNCAEVLVHYASIYTTPSLTSWK